MPLDLRTQTYVAGYIDGGAGSAPREVYYNPSAASSTSDGGTTDPGTTTTSGKVVAFSGEVRPLQSRVVYIGGVAFGAKVNNPAPEAVTASDNGDLTATLSWSAPTGGTPTGYEVARDGTDSGGLGPYKEVVGSSVRSFRFTKLVSGSTYNLSVTALYDTTRSSTVTRPITIGSTTTTSTVDLTPTEDVFVSQAFPTKNRNADGKLRTDSDVRSWLKFNLASVVGTLQSASLTLRCGLNAGSVDTQDVSVSDNTAWTETELIWDTQPVYGATVASATGTKTGGSDYTWALPVTALQAKTGGLLSLVMHQAGTDGVDWADRMSTTPPKLTLTYSGIAAPGTYQPTATNTGAKGTLTAHTGDITVSTVGAVTIENLHISGRVRVTSDTAGPVTLRNCILRIGALSSTAVTAAFDVPYTTASSIAHVMQDCTVIPSTRGVTAYGARGRNIAARRNNIQGVVDGFQVWGDCTIEANYIYDLPFYEVDPFHSDGSHGDGIQYEGGGTLVARGNLIDHAQTTANISIILTQNVGLITKATIDRNWLHRGKLAFVASQKGKGGFPLVLTGNRTDDLYSAGGSHVGSIEAATYDAMTVSDNLRLNGTQATFFRQT